MVLRSFRAHRIKPYTLEYLDARACDCATWMSLRLNANAQGWKSGCTIFGQGGAYVDRINVGVYHKRQCTLLKKLAVSLPSQSKRGLPPKQKRWQETISGELPLQTEEEIQTVVQRCIMHFGETETWTHLVKQQYTLHNPHTISSSKLVLQNHVLSTRRYMKLNFQS